MTTKNYVDHKNLKLFYDFQPIGDALVLIIDLAMPRLNGNLSRPRPDKIFGKEPLLDKIMFVIKDSKVVDIKLEAYHLDHTKAAHNAKEVRSAWEESLSKHPNALDALTDFISSAANSNNQVQFGKDFLEAINLAVESALSDKQKVSSLEEIALKIGQLRRESNILGVSFNKIANPNSL